MTKREEAEVSVDLQLTDVYSSWMTSGVELDDDQREMVFSHFRLAFLAGRDAQLEQIESNPHYQRLVAAAANAV